MSGKSTLTNSIRSGDGSFRLNSYHEKLHYTSSNEEKIKFAGDESKDRLYEPKRNKKMMRVVTVVVYVFSVSLAAIMLSLYYIFFWNPKGPQYLPIKIDVLSAAGNNTPTDCHQTKGDNNAIEPTTLQYLIDADIPFQEESATGSVLDSNDDRNFIKSMDYVDANDTNIEQALYENNLRSNILFKRIEEASRDEDKVRR